MVKFILGIGVGFLCILFFVQNSEIVSVSFMFWTLSLPRYLLMTLFLVAGMLLGWIMTSLSHIRKRKEDKK